MSRQKIFAFVYLLLLSFFAVSIAFRLPDIRLDASLHSVMPDPENTGNVEKSIAQAYVTKSKSKVVFLVSDNDTVKSVNALYKSLSNHPSVDYIIGKMPSDVEEDISYYLTVNASSLVTENIRASLESPDFVEDNFYLAVDNSKNKNPLVDPLCFKEIISNHIGRSTLFYIKNDYWSVRYKGNDWYYLEAILKTDISSIRSRRQFVQYVNSCIEDIQSINPNVRILTRGDCYNSDFFSSHGLKDVMYFGTTSLILIFAFIYLVFRQTRIVLSVLLSTLCAVIGGLYVTLLFFDTVSVILLAVYICLTGTVCDYTIYYAFKRYKDGNTHDIFTLKSFYIPFALVASSDLIAYVVMVIAPVDSIKQFALFSTGALTMSILFVYCIEPLILKKVEKPNKNLIMWFRNTFKVLRNPVFESVVVGFVFITIVFGIYSYRVNDDVRQIQNLPSSMVSQDLLITEITGVTNSSKFVVVYDTDQQRMLEKYDEVKAILYRAKQQEIIATYKACPYNSIKTQIEDKQTLNRLTHGLAAYYQENKINAFVNDYSDNIIKFKDFIDSDLGRYYMYQYHEGNGIYAMTILIKNIYDREALEEALTAVSGVQVSDYYTDIETIFHDFREKMYIVIICFCILLMIVYVMHFGLLIGFTCALANVLSVVFAMSVMLIFNYSFNVYNLVPLTLILGLGVNYSLFYVKSSNEHIKINFMGISTTYATTILSLSILAFNSAQVFRSIGLAIACGITASYFLTAIIPPVLEKKEISKLFAQAFFKAKK